MSFQLDLSGNRLTHVGARHLLSQLSGQCLELDLHANRIGAYGCLTISNCILRSSSHELMVLHLGLNDLQDEVSRQSDCTESGSLTTAVDIILTAFHLFMVAATGIVCRLFEI